MPAVSSPTVDLSISRNPVPLSAVAQVQPPGNGPLSISHNGMLPAVNLSFNLAPGVSLGDAVNRVQDLADRTLPSTITTSFQGTAQAFQQSTSNLPILLLLHWRY